MWRLPKIPVPAKAPRATSLEKPHPPTSLGCVVSLSISFWTPLLRSMLKSLPDKLQVCFAQSGAQILFSGTARNLVFIRGGACEKQTSGCYQRQHGLVFVAHADVLWQRMSNFRQAVDKHVYKVSPAGGRQESSEGLGLDFCYPIFLRQICWFILQVSKEITWVGSLLRFCSLQAVKAEMSLTWANALFSFHIHHVVSHGMDSEN